MADINVTVPDKAPVHVDWTSPDYQWSASGPTQAPAVLSESVPTIVGKFFFCTQLWRFPPVPFSSSYLLSSLHCRRILGSRGSLCLCHRKSHHLDHPSTTTEGRGIGSCPRR